MQHQFDAVVQTVDAVQWRHNNEADIISFFPQGTRLIWGQGVVALMPDDAGNVRIDPGEWLVRFPDGQLGLYPDTLFSRHFSPRG